MPRKYGVLKDAVKLLSLLLVLQGVRIAGSMGEDGVSPMDAPIDLKTPRIKGDGATVWVGRAAYRDCHVQTASEGGKTVTLSTSTGVIQVEWLKVRATDRKEKLFAEYSRAVGGQQNTLRRARESEDRANGIVVETKASREQVADSTASSYERRTFATEEGILPYRILFPRNFDSNGKYPLILVLHGAGERGNDNQLQLVIGSRLFLQEEVRNKFPSVVVFPQCPAGSFWSNVDVQTDSSGNRAFHFRGDGEPTIAMDLLVKLIDDLSRRPYIDSSCLYVGGLSMGGMGTFELLSRRPELFAAAFPICGGGDPRAVGKYAKQVSLWVFHGAKDDVVPVKHSETMVSALKKAGADVRVSVYPDVMHNSWVPAFAEPDLLPWLFSHSRK